MLNKRYKEEIIKLTRVSLKDLHGDDPRYQEISSRLNKLLEEEYNSGGVDIRNDPAQPTVRDWGFGGWYNGDKLIRVWFE